MDPVTVVKLWLVIRPIRLIRTRRRAKRGLPPLTDEDAMKGQMLKLGVLDENGNVMREIQREEPVVNARTSTKTGASAFAVPVVAVLGVLPFYKQAGDFIREVCAQPEPLDFIITGVVVWAATAGTMYLTSRKTKSPIEPGAL